MFIDIHAHAYCFLVPRRMGALILHAGGAASALR